MSVDEETLRGEDVPEPVEVPEWCEDRTAHLEDRSAGQRVSVLSLTTAGEWMSSDEWTTLSEAR